MQIIQEVISCINALFRILTIHLVSFRYQDDKKRHQNGRSSASSCGVSAGGTGAFPAAFTGSSPASFPAALRSPELTKAIESAVMESCTWLSPFLSSHKEYDSVPSTSTSRPLVSYSDRRICPSLLLRTHTHVATLCPFE